MAQTTSKIEGELNRAKDSLKAAEQLLEFGLFADSVSRSYYAVYHSARALLLKHSLVPKTHKGVASLFAQHFVKTGKIPKEFMVILKEEKEDRQLGDYEPLEEFDSQRAEKRLNDAKRFLLQMEKLIRQ